MARRNAKASPSFAEFCADPELLNEPISKAWVVVFKGLDGEPLNAEEIELWRALTGLDDYEPCERRELVARKGRRAWGTRTAVKYFIYHAHTTDFQRFAPKGERLHAVIIMQDLDTARETMATFANFYANSPLLNGEVVDVLKNKIVLRNGFVISVKTCSYRAPRGISAPLGLCDELGVWRVEGVDVDKGVLRSLRPAQILFPNRKLVLLGSPWLKTGELFEADQHPFERPDRLVVHVPTALGNPQIPPEELERERQADPQNYRREYLGEWLDDVDQFLPDSDISAAIRVGVREVPPVDALKGQYTAAIDASSLTGRDRFVFGVGHRAVAGNSGVGLSLDLLRGWTRSTVTETCDEIAMLAKSYDIRTVSADQHGFAFLRELMSQRGIELRQLPFTTRSKPEIFLDLKLALAQGRLHLLDHTEALRELRMLESKRTSGGNYSISAPRGQHDDFACALALLVHEAKRGASGGRAYISSDGQGVRIGEKPVAVHPANVPRFWPRKTNL